MRVGGLAADPVLLRVAGGRRLVSLARTDGIWVCSSCFGLRQAKEGIRKMVGLQREVPAWHKRLTERLSGDVHMVGPTISCEGTPRDGGPAAEWRTLPHVQSHAIAVDQVPLTHLSPNPWMLNG